MKKISIHMLLFGLNIFLLCVAGSIFLHGPASVSAAVNDYKYTWTATKFVYANVAGTGSRTGTPPKMIVGVSDWDIAGTIAGYTYHETRRITAEGFKTSGNAPNTLDGCKVTFQIGQTKTSDADFKSPDTAGYGVQIAPTGMYGLLCWYLNRAGLDSDEYNTASLTPTLWHVHATITTP